MKEKTGLRIPAGTGLEVCMGREFELKYRSTPQAQTAILADFPGFRQIQMETTYFDTPGGALSARKITLRLRKENDITVCTLKTPLSDGSRGEWECQACDLESGLRQLGALGAPAEILALDGSNLVAVCGARFIRHAATVSTADGLAELAVDRGSLLGGGREVSLCEVEVELKEGSDEAALAFAQALADQYDLAPETKSKFRRAMDLTEGE